MQNKAAVIITKVSTHSLEREKRPQGRNMLFAENKKGATSKRNFS